MRRSRPATFYTWKHEAEVEKREDKKRLKELEVSNCLKISKK
jgi:hypothetical protein